MSSSTPTSSKTRALSSARATKNGSGIPPTRAEMLPPRLLPLLYFGAAYGALALAFAAVAFDPARFSGFYYHAGMVAVVHLITLGWISASILGAIYIVGPLALRMPMHARSSDYVAFAFVVAGGAGMVGCFWIERYGGMVWSGVMTVAGIALVAMRVLSALPRARIPLPVKVHVGLAFVNILGAGGMGVLLGFEKDHRFLSGQALSNVFAHAHLAALGWAGMMVLGTGYRLLPMILPAAMPQGRSLWASALLLQVGSVGIFGALLARSAWLPLFGFLAACGFGAFLVHVAWMKRHPRPAPAALRRPDFGALHAVEAMIYLALAALLGLTLSFVPTSDRSLKCAAVYGVFGLIGFLSQMVLGIGARLVPMFASVHAIVREGDLLPEAPHKMPIRALQAATFTLWTAGVPVVAGALYFEAAAVLGVGAWMLLAATVLSALNTASVARHAFRRHAAAGLSSDHTFH